MEACFSDFNSYASCTEAKLKASYDAGLRTDGEHSITITLPAGSYCISAEGKSGEFIKKAGPGSDIVGPKNPDGTATTACT